MDFRDLIGLTESEAIKKVKDRGLHARVTRRDKNYCVVTRDFRLERINLELDRGLVTKVYNG